MVARRRDGGGRRKEGQNEYRVIVGDLYTIGSKEEQGWYRVDDFYSYILTRVAAEAGEQSGAPGLVGAKGCRQSHSGPGRPEEYRALGSLRLHGGPGFDEGDGRADTEVSDGSAGPHESGGREEVQCRDR